MRQNINRRAAKNILIEEGRGKWGLAIFFFNHYIYLLSRSSSHLINSILSYWFEQARQIRCGNLIKLTIGRQTVKLLAKKFKINYRKQKEQTRKRQGTTLKHNIQEVNKQTDTMEVEHRWNTSGGGGLSQMRKTRKEVKQEKKIQKPNTRK